MPESWRRFRDPTWPITSKLDDIIREILQLSINPEIGKQMDERRGFFRIKNNGEILTHIYQHPLHLIDISATGACITTSTNLPPKGTIELLILNKVSMDIQYEILKTDPSNTIIIFTQESEINRLFNVLKRLRDGR